MPRFLRLLPKQTTTFVFEVVGTATGNPSTSNNDFMGYLKKKCMIRQMFLSGATWAETSPGPYLFSGLIGSGFDLGWDSGPATWSYISPCALRGILVDRKIEMIYGLR